MAAKTISFKIYQDTKKVIREGIVIRIAIIVPFTKISLKPFFFSSNELSLKLGNKNQKYFIFGKKKFF
jgi:hypothetical protein